MVGAVGLFLLRLRLASVTRLRFFRCASLPLASSKATFARRQKNVRRTFFFSPAYSGRRFETLTLTNKIKSRVLSLLFILWWAL